MKQGKTHTTIKDEDADDHWAVKAVAWNVSTAANIMAMKDKNEMKKEPQLMITAVVLMMMHGMPTPKKLEQDKEQKKHAQQEFARAR